MRESEEKLSRKEARRLADIATQTSFTWTVMFLAFIAGLVGLLQIAKPYESTRGWWVFSILLSIAYFILTFGLSYSVYATLHTRYVILLLRDLVESANTRSFLNKHWHRLYTPLIVVPRNNKIMFRKQLAVFLSVLGGIISILLLLSLFLSSC